jgi:hypothetical protein
MKPQILAIVIIAIIIIAGITLYFVFSPKKSTGSTLLQTNATASGMNVEISSDNLTVGFQSGLWQMALYNSGSVAVSKIVVYLETPTPSEVCSGSTVSSGLSFSFCTVAPSGNPLPPASTLTGEASGIGEGSATVGSHYPVAAKVLFSNGDTVWVNSTVIATTAP